MIKGEGKKKVKKGTAKEVFFIGTRPGVSKARNEALIDLKSIDCLNITLNGIVASIGNNHCLFGGLIDEKWECLMNRNNKVVERRKER